MLFFILHIYFEDFVLQYLCVIMLDFVFTFWPSKMQDELQDG
jgi:hypothetical protein